MPAGFGSRLRRARDQAQLTQEDLSRLAGLSREWIARIESGVDPRLSHATLLAEQLAKRVPGLTVAGLLLNNPSGPDRSGMPLGPGQSREIGPLVLAESVSTFTGTSDPERLAHAARGGVVDDRLLDDLHALARVYARQRATMPPGQLLPLVQRHWAALAILLAEQSKPSRRLLSIAGETAGLAGWLRLALDDRGSANQYLNVASELAQQAGDAQVQVLVSVLKADLQSAVPHGGQGGYPGRARELLAHAVAKSAPPMAAELRTWALLRSAEEHAFAGQTTEAFRDIEAADRLWRTAEYREEDLCGRWDKETTLIAAFAGNCAQMLSRSSEAVRLLTEVVSRKPVSLVSDRAAALTDLAAAHARQPDADLDRSCSLLMEAVSLVAKADLPERARRIIGIRQQHLSRWHSSVALRQLDEQIARIV